MRKRFGCSVTLPMLALLLFSPSALAQKYPPPFPREGAKNVPIRYTEEQLGKDNALVVWDVEWEKGKPTGMRKLDLDQVSVTLVEGAVKVTRPDGTWSIEHERFGAVRFKSKGTVEAEEGVSDAPSRATVFQIKDFRPPLLMPIREGMPDTFPRRGAIKLFETDRITVWDSTLEAGEREKVHLHYRQAASVCLTPGKGRGFTAEGTPDPFFEDKGKGFEKKVGDVVGSIVHPNPFYSVVDEGPMRAIFVQFK